MEKDAVDDQYQMGQYKADKDRQQKFDRFFHAAQVEDHQQQHETQTGSQFERLRRDRQQ
ncbi:MAG: hypothetical protein Q8K06_07255 [Sulfuriferula sp.]|nr:hypothetical protein [Sulfuriferula sp.]MDP2025981.1 hypothetical protein [Sulfuriferula sp.]